jgi:hypothetical protein
LSRLEARGGPGEHRPDTAVDHRNDATRVAFDRCLRYE